MQRSREASSRIGQLPSPPPLSSDHLVNEHNWLQYWILGLFLGTMKPTCSSHKYCSWCHSHLASTVTLAVISVFWLKRKPGSSSIRRAWMCYVFPWYVDFWDVVVQKKQRGYLSASWILNGEFCETTGRKKLHSETLADEWSKRGNHDVIYLLIHYVSLESFKNVRFVFKISIMNASASMEQILILISTKVCTICTKVPMNWNGDNIISTEWRSAPFLNFTSLKCPEMLRNALKCLIERRYREFRQGAWRPELLVLRTWNYLAFLTFFLYDDFTSGYKPIQALESSRNLWTFLSIFEGIQNEEDASGEWGENVLEKLGSWGRQFADSRLFWSDACYCLALGNVRVSQVSTQVSTQFQPPKNRFFLAS